MKNFFCWILLFFISIVVVDQIFGIGIQYCIVNSKGGDTKSHEYIAHHCNEDILIFGSSRALHHYVPSIISDSLNKTCFNCGVDGNGILFLYSRLLLITESYSPQMIIYDVNADFDISEDNYSKYLGWQRRYSDNTRVKDVICDIDPTEELKLYSNLYKHNGKFSQILADYFHSSGEDRNSGYLPMYGSIDYDVTEISEPDTIVHWAPIKKMYFEKFLSLCIDRNIKLVIVYSPLFVAKSSTSFSEFTQFCIANNIEVLDYYANPQFQNKEWFVDTSHLNDDGAKIFTTQLCSDLLSDLEIGRVF